MTTAKQQRTIWKFPLAIVCEQAITIPRVHHWLDVQVQDGTPVLWAIVNPLTAPTKVEIRMCGTGRDAPEPEDVYLGTVQLDSFVWHYFEVCND